MNKAGYEARTLSAGSQQAGCPTTYRYRASCGDVVTFEQEPAIPEVDGQVQAQKVFIILRVPVNVHIEWRYDDRERLVMGSCRSEMLQHTVRDLLGQRNGVRDFMITFRHGALNTGVCIATGNDSMRERRRVMNLALTPPRTGQTPSAES